MTQIVGIVCKEAIVVASESQYTIGKFNFKRNEQPKMDVLTFNNSAWALVAFAGDVTSAFLVIGMMKEAAKTISLNSDLTVIDLAKDAIKRYRLEVLDFYNQKPDFSATQQDEIFGRGDQNIEFVIAYYHKEKPFLYKIDVFSGKSSRIEDYVVTGCGSTLATFMLDQFQSQCKEMKMGQAVLLTIDALERIKESDPGCGGTVKVGILKPETADYVSVGALKDDFVECRVQDLKELRKENVAWLKGKYTEILDRSNKENYEKIVQKIEIEKELGNIWRKKYPVSVGVAKPNNESKLK